LIEIRQTATFRDWMDNLGDRRAAERIAQRLVRLQVGLFGDVKPVGAGISELRVDHGPGYRVYFMQRNRTVVVLLCGGDKRTQTRDIKIAKAMAAEIKESRP
jgi:putative addiction module killer protein